MTAATYDAAMVRVFADEGGYTNDPVDPGGATNFGITIFDYRKYINPNGTPNDVRNMSKADATKIYRLHYANPMRYDDLPAGFDYSVLDAAINSGVGRAPVWAARALGMPSTNHIADIVEPANKAPDKVVAIQKYWAARLSFLHSLRTWDHFKGGWGRRCAQGEAAAVRMWLSVGLKLPAQDARKKMDIEADKAKKASTKAGTGAATSGAGPVIGGGALDWSHWSAWEWIAAGAVGVAIALLLAFFIRQVIIHNQRAAAYAAA